MPPRFARYDVGYAPLADPEQGCNVSPCQTRRIQTTDFTHFGFGEDRSVVALSSLSGLRMHAGPTSFAASMPHSALSDAISVVFGSCAKENTRRVDTRRLVTAVTSANLWGNLPKMDCPTDAVGEVVSPINEKQSISIAVFGAPPEPTLVLSSLLHLLPEAAFVLFAELWQKAASLIRIHTTDWVRTQRPLTRLLGPSF